MTRTNWVASTIGGTSGQSGNANGVGANARFSDPFGIALDGSGNLFIVDEENNNVRWGVPLQPMSLSPKAVASVLTFGWNAIPGVTYQLQMKTNLAQGKWLNLGAGIRATNSTAIASDPITSDPQRFYRVQAVH